MPLPSTAYGLATAQSSPGGSLTDFSAWVDLAQLPSTWWDEVDTTDPTRGRIALNDGTELACCWIDFDSVAKTGYVWFLLPGVTGVSDTPAIRVYPPKAANAAVAAGDTYGRNNAFNSGWLAFFPLSDLVDYTGNQSDLTAYNAPTAGQTGKFGDCYEFAAASSQRLEVAISSQNVGDVTIIGWGLLTGDAGQSRNTIGSINSSSVQRHVYLGHRKLINSLQMEYYNITAGSEDYAAINPNSATWYHWAGRSNLTTNVIEAFISGASPGTSSNTQADGTIDRLTIGARNSSVGPDYFWQGRVQWLQFHAADRGADWIAFDRLIGNDNSAFWGSWTLVGGSTPITPGSLSVTARSESQVSLSVSAATGGDDTLTYQLQRSANTGAALSWSNIGAAQETLTWTDSTVSADSPYLYRVEVSDGGQTETTASIAVDTQDPLVVQLPIYGGRPGITGLSANPTPKIVVDRITSAQPAMLFVSAAESTLPAGKYADYDYRWDFGDPSGVETFTDELTGQTVNANDSQRGAEASYIYREPGSYTITLTVTGRDANGVTYTATTTSLVVQERYGIHIGDATGGTFTLTYGGNTTSAIAFDADDATVAAALHALPGLDSTNCYVRGGCVVFIGALSGVNTDLTADFAGLTGGTAGTAPVLRVEAARATGSQVTVTSIAGWTENFFDPDYGGENGASDGTELRPWTTRAHLNTFLTGGNQRVASLKCETTMSDFTTRIKWETGKELRIRSYGTGAKPILTGGGTFFVWEGSHSESATDKEFGDVVFSNIHIDAIGDGTAFSATIGVNGHRYRPYVKGLPIILDNVGFTTTGTGTARPVSLSISPFRGSAGIQAVGVWKPEFDQVLGEESAVFVTIDRWFSTVGGWIAGGDGHEIFDHHIYNNTHFHTSCRYVEGRTAVSKGFFCNTNVDPGTGYVARFHWFQGCDVTGTMNGIDFSNSNNSQGANDGYFKDVCIEGCRIHSAQIVTATPQQIGVYGANCEDITVRDCLFYDNEDGGMNVGGSARPPEFSVYRNRNYGDWFIAVTDANSGYVVDNIMHAASGGTCVRFASSAYLTNWEFDRNQYWAPGAGDEPFYNSSTLADIDFATWQGYGPDDANSLEADPNWNDPGNGDFSQAGDSSTPSGIARVVGYDVAGNVAFDVSGPPWLLTPA